jgi:hypothetical protein
MKFYAVVEEVRKVEFTFDDFEIEADMEDEFVAANAFADEELKGTSEVIRYVDVYPQDEGVE